MNDVTSGHPFLVLLFFSSLLAKEDGIPLNDRTSSERQGIRGSRGYSPCPLLVSPRISRHRLLLRQLMIEKEREKRASLLLALVTCRPVSLGVGTAAQAHKRLTMTKQWRKETARRMEWMDGLA